MKRLRRSGQFAGKLRFSEGITVRRANVLRTASYAAKEMEAMSIASVEATPRRELLETRRAQLAAILRYHTKGVKSHRTVVALLDAETAQLLDEARECALAALRAGNAGRCITSRLDDTRGLWVPALNLLPRGDLHITVCTPWWWHTMGADRAALSKSMAHRWMQTLHLGRHVPFVVELDRIILLGGRTLVACFKEARAPSHVFLLQKRKPTRARARSLSSSLARDSEGDALQAVARGRHARLGARSHQGSARRSQRFTSNQRGSNFPEPPLHDDVI